MMEEKTYRFKINKNDGCKRFMRIRKMIEEKGGEHLYDAIYPSTEKDGYMDASVTYKANKQFKISEI